jgi:hypothetical protein
MNEIKKVRILGIDYGIKYCDTRAENGSESVGNVDNQACKITINSRVNKIPHAMSVLLHEIIEALDYRLELDLKHERITQLEAGLIQVIRDNPKLLQALAR